MTLPELRAVAEAATPGPWEVTECLDVWVSQSGDGIEVAQTGNHEWIGASNMTEASMKANGRYIATFDPPTVLALLGKMEIATDALQRIVACQNVAGPNSLHNAGNYARAALAALDEALK